MAEKDDSMSEGVEKLDPEVEVKHDEELDELLEDALQDFGEVKVSESVAQASSETIKKDNGSIPDEKWTEEFLKQATAHFEQNMQSLLQGSDLPNSLNMESYTSEFQRLQSFLTENVMSDENASNFSNAISQTLRNLSEDSENLQNQCSNQYTPENLLNMFGNLNLDESGDGVGEFLPFMQQMMQTLLSKDVLYPALKDIVDKYPDWLENNKGKISDSEYDKYSEQLKLMAEVCSELEKENEFDSAEVKRQRFDSILNLMQKMQDCGQPPADLVGDLGSFPTFDEQGNPRIPGMDPSQCSVM